MSKKNQLDPSWRWDVRPVQYDEEVALDTFIANLTKAAEGLANPTVKITGYGDREYGESWVEVTLRGTRPKTDQELEQERKIAEWQKQRDADIKKQIEENERKEFLRLYKKYGKNKE